MASERDKASDWKVFLAGTISFAVLGAFVAIRARLGGLDWIATGRAWIGTSAYIVMSVVAVATQWFPNDNAKAGVLLAVVLQFSAKLFVP